MENSSARRRENQREKRKGRKWRVWNYEKMLPLFLAMVLCIGAFGCGSVRQEERFEAERQPENSKEKADGGQTGRKPENDADNAADQKTDSIGAWVVYWDLDNAVEELQNGEAYLDTISFFAAYFDENDTPFIPEQTAALLEAVTEDAEAEGKKVQRYLTFVNDKILKEGGSSLKDTELLHRLLAKPEGACAHAEKILEMTKAGGYDGIEIDYEAIKKDKQLWQPFIAFVEELIRQAQEADIDVRIVLEPGAPVQEYDFPEGPEYVLMCYNLYGYGTEPGPKADPAFLQEMITMAEYLPGEVNFALATGGFDFGADGSVAQLRREDAELLAEQSGAEPRRDENSGDMVFGYTDEAGMTHQVWYADEDTLGGWMQLIRDEGYDRFMLWRIGGNL